MPIYTSRDYIRTGQYVYFRGKNWENFVSEKVFRISYSQLFPYRLPGCVVKAGSFIPLDLKETLKMYPDSQYTLYEIGVALRGDAVLYVQLPLRQFYFYLEAVGSPTSPTSAGYMGAFTPKDLPEESPYRLREYITKNEQKIVYVLANDTAEDQKVIVSFEVNRLRLEKLPDEEQKKILENKEEYVQKGLLVELPHWSLARWEER